MEIAKKCINPEELEGLVSALRDGGFLADPDESIDEIVVYKPGPGVSNIINIHAPSGLSENTGYI